jgi:uncharacterized protein YndB with AHSA1/START domain
MFVSQSLTKTKQKLMNTAEKTAITIDAIVKSPIEKVWAYWNEPAHITKWAFAIDSWHAPVAENDLRKEGKFKTRMEAKDGSMGFDFEGIYNNVETHKVIEYTIADGRKVKTVFAANGNETKITQTFEAESENSIEMQRGGWQAILDNFRKYAQSH